MCQSFPRLDQVCALTGFIFEALDDEIEIEWIKLNAILTRQVSAVTAACLAVEKHKYLKVEGFDSVNFPVGHNDVDFCLRLMEQGYRNIWTPFAKFIHHESVSRGKEDTIAKQLRSKRKVAYFRKRWAKMVNNDPFYNPNPTLEHSEFPLAKQGRRQLSWTDFAVHKD